MGEFAGQTRFLDYGCLVRDFKQRVHIGYFDDAQAVILMTDGISDPRFETDAGLENQQKWQALWQELNHTYNRNNLNRPYWNGRHSLVQDTMMIELWQFYGRFRQGSIHDSSMVTEPVEINGEKNMSKVIQCQTLDGRPIAFIDEVIGSGAMKDVYFSPDKSYVVCF